DHDLARRVAEGIGVEPPAAFAGTPTDMALPEVSVVRRGRYDTVATRKVAVLLADGFDHDAFQSVKQALEDGGAMVKTVAPAQRAYTSAGGETVTADESFTT